VQRYKSILNNKSIVKLNIKMYLTFIIL